MTEYDIPFNRPWISGREIEYISRAVASGRLSGDGPFTLRCQQILHDEFGHRDVLLTTSCTDALELCALLLRVGPGDEVILPSFTFVSVANAFVLRGARPVFVDVDPHMLNIDPDCVERAVTTRTKAIVAVHYAGVGCAMDELISIADQHHVPLVEDNAHGLGGAYRGRPLGSLGSLATLSFHETKNFTCGEGGALVINDGSLVERAEVLREKGTDRSRFFRGQVDKYGWIDLGSSFLPSELVAAHLAAQLEARDEIARRRRHIWQQYRSSLQPWAQERNIRLPHVPADREHPSHMFYLVMPSLEARTALIRHLRLARAMAVFHYLPLHLSVMGRGFGGAPGQCPVTEDVSDRLVRLPFYTGMEPEDQARVIDAVLSFDTAAPAVV